MRIFIAEFKQETNTFSPVPTNICDFERGYIIKGEEIKNTLKDTNTEVGGFIQVLEKNQEVEIIYGMAFWAVAAGRLVEKDFTVLLTNFLDCLKTALPVDGILCAFHGALASETIDDCEAWILHKIRRIVGNTVPIVCSLDFHANVTEEMVRQATALIGYRTYPHNDFKETGERAAEVIMKLISSNSGNPTAVINRLKMILPVENTETGSGPMKPVIERLKEFDKDPNILCASIFCPHPWLDVADFGITFLVYSTDTHLNDIKETSKKVISYLWDNRKSFFLKFPDIATVLNGIDAYKKPVIIVDSGDVTSAGAVGDSTEILRKVLQMRIKKRIIISIVDPMTVKNAISVGEGNDSTFTIGGKEEYGYNSQVLISGTVKKITNDSIALRSGSFSGVKISSGKRVLLCVGDQLFIIVSQYAPWTHDPEFVRSMGIEPESTDIIVQKSHKLFRVAYEHIAGSYVIVDTSGFSTMDMKQLTYSHIQRPIYPLEDMIDFDSNQLKVFTGDTYE